MVGLEDAGSWLSGPALAAALVGTGLILGFLTGLFGVGGGFILVPLLNVPLGIEYSLAKGVSLCSMVGTGVAGLVRHGRMGNVARKTMLIISGGAMCGAVLGGMVNDVLEQGLCGGDQRAFTLIMHPLYIVLLIAAAWLVIRGRDDTDGERSPLQKLPLGPKIEIRLTGQRGVSLPGLCYLGVAVGFLTGLLGIGGGVLMMPLLCGVVGLGARQAIGTSLGVVLLASMAGTVKYALNDQVSLVMSMCILISSTIGVQIGAWVCSVLHVGKIRRYFALLVIAVIVMVMVDFVGRLT